MLNSCSTRVHSWRFSWITGLGGSNWAYGYDAATEITGATYFAGGGSTTGTRTYDAAAELKTLLGTQGSTKVRSLSLTYNNNGDRTSQTDGVSGITSGYTYDQEDRLTKYTSGSTTSFSYGYNGDGLRMSKLNNISGPPPPRPGQPGGQPGDQAPQGPALAPIQYTWDIAGGLPLMVQDAAGSYIYGPGGEIIEQIDNANNAYYYHADQLGSIRALTNSSCTVVDSYSYDAYGNTTASSGTVPNQFRYAGEYQDAESNLYYLRAGYYDPATQQFLTVDPLLPLTQEAYAYVGGSPTNASDPMGLAVPLPPLPTPPAQKPPTTFNPFDPNQYQCTAPFFWCFGQQAPSGNLSLQALALTDNIWYSGWHERANSKPVIRGDQLARGQAVASLGTA